MALNVVGFKGGQVASFSYDLARSVVYTRQGNPAWAGLERDGQAGPIRSDDLFFGGAAADWVNLDKVMIPQADEQQRLFANLIITINTRNKPLPIKRKVLRLDCMLVPTATTVASALARNVPIVSSRQMLSWIDGRNSSFFKAIDYEEHVLTFKIKADAGAKNLRAICPPAALLACPPSNQKTATCNCSVPLREPIL